MLAAGACPMHCSSNRPSRRFSSPTGGRGIQLYYSYLGFVGQSWFLEGSKRRGENFFEGATGSAPGTAATLRCMRVPAAV